MNAKFLAKGTMAFDRDGRKITLIYGDVIEGEVKQGMYVNIPFNPSFSMACEIESVEFIDIKIGVESYVALLLKTEEDPDEEAELIMGLNISDEELQVVNV